jgi:type IV secretion system protein VirD4
MFVCLAALAAKMGWLMFIIAILVIIGLAKRGYGALTAFGTARFASASDLRKAGMLGARTGLIIGRVVDEGKPPFSKALSGLFNVRVASKDACQEFLSGVQIGRKPAINPALVRMPKAVHTMICAPTGVGKGVSCVVPFLMSNPESAVVVDFKGENAKLTAKFRQKAFGHRIVILDPFKVATKTPDTFNPLDFIDKDSPVAIDECIDIAQSLVIRTGQEKDPHWADSAEAWIAAMISLVVQYGEPNDRSLQTVRTLLTSPEKLEMAIKLMGASDAWEGMLARMGNQLTNYKDKELNSTMTTTNRFLRFLDTLAVLNSTKTSSFNPADLRKGKTTVYLILPPDHMRAQSPLLRMWIGSLLRAVVRGGLQEENKVHFVLDESSSLGHLEALDDAVDKFRGYGVRLQFYYQSLGQIKKCFPDGQDQTLLSNVSQVFFGVNDMATAEYVSNRLGEETIVVSSGGTSTGRSRQSSSNGDGGSSGTSSSQNHNWNQHGRKLLKPEEVLALDGRTAITFTPGVQPICTRLVRHYEEPNLAQPGIFQQFKEAARVLVGSALLLFVAVFLAVALSMNSQGRAATGQPPVRWDVNQPQRKQPPVRRDVNQPQGKKPPVMWDIPNDVQFPNPKEVRDRKA